MNMSNKKILIADDDSDIIQLMQEILYATFKEDNLHIDTCLNGKLATEFTKKNTYDLIFLDLKMPELGGLDTIKVIREHQCNNKEVPIVIVSGLIRQISSSSNKIYYIDKPLESSSFEKTVKSLLLN